MTEQTSELPTFEEFDERHRVVIIGGGNAGVSVAAQLVRRLKGLDVAIVESFDIESAFDRIRPAVFGTNISGPFSPTIHG